ncbi:MAG: zinc dependent phospholipase C family protein [Synergistaceae bacterium]|nr:zinc dependent phospholipase C family protein [Synergistaceae bacterium]
MKTKSHVLLAGYLLRQIPTVDSVIHQKVFALGCIEPDFNMFSYLKGSAKCQKLRGHNYNSSTNYIIRVLNRLQGKNSWNLWDCYRLGKLMHYLADAFTYPHNDGFTGTLWEHRIYEARLHAYFAAYLKQRSEENRANCLPTVKEYICEAHKQYMKTSGDVKNDAAYIKQATSRVMRALVQGLAPVRYEKGEIPYENTDYNRLVCTNR